MGLFMVKTQMSAMNGTVDVQSGPGKGSTFILTFPV
ncbi:MAG: ATP-binding protein [Bacteroidia bacterium]